MGGDFSPETEICSHGWTGLRFNKPDWNYSSLPQPKRLINGIFMKGTSKMNISERNEGNAWGYSVLSAVLDSLCFRSK